jgi:predicted metal-dependent phosphoesterase TrpH
MLALGVDGGFDDGRAQVAGGGSVGRPHLARALLAKGIVSNIQEAFDKYLADGEKGFVKLKRLTSADIVPMVNESDGIVVIAHPKRLREERYLAEIADLGVEGVEVVHPSADAAYQRHLTEFAEERGLLGTGGTDFHAPETHALPGIMFSRDRLERFLARVAALA